MVAKQRNVYNVCVVPGLHLMISYSGFKRGQIKYINVTKIVKYINIYRSSV